MSVLLIFQPTNAYPESQLIVHALERHFGRRANVTWGDRPPPYKITLPVEPQHLADAAMLYLDMHRVVWSVEGLDIPTQNP